MSIKIFWKSPVGLITAYGMLYISFKIQLLYNMNFYLYIVHGLHYFLFFFKNSTRFNQRCTYASLNVLYAPMQISLNKFSIMNDAVTL